MNTHTIDDLLAIYNEGKVPGCAVVVIQDGTVTYKYVGGYADLENTIPVTLETNFRLCSVTKQFTASAVLLLVNRGSISLTDSLEMFFPRFPDYGKKITIQELLTHTSGLIDYEELIQNNSTYQIHDEGVLELLMKQDHGYFVPESNYKYSNGGYCLLKIIIEKVSAEDFGEFLKKNIFLPLGMTATIVNKEGITDIKNRAFGYSKKNEGWIRTDQNITSATIGDGGVYSSVEDLYKWDQSLYSESILSKENIREMFTEHILTNEDFNKVYYGFGFFLKEYRGHSVEYHEGDSIGFRTGIYRIPGIQTSVIFLSNRNEGEGKIVCQKIIDCII